MLLEHEHGRFWALQYQPEYDAHEVASLCRLRKGELVAQGTFADDAEAEAYIAKLEALHENPDDVALAKSLGVGAGLLDLAARTTESPQLARKPWTRLASGAMLESCRRSLAPVLVLLCAVAPASLARAAFVQSIPQICQEGNNCETGTVVSIPGQQSDMSRAWNPGPGFSYAASAAIATDFAAFSAFARGSGFENPEGSSTTFINLVSRGGRAFGHAHDTVTAGTGGGAGFLRLPLHLVGHTSISWQNGFGTSSFGVSCHSQQGTVPLGSCDPVFANFTNNAGIDQVANMDVPIVLGSPITFTLSLNVEAVTGHLYGDLIPFTGQSEITIATQPFEGAIVLGASRQPIAGATVSSESGFNYAAPEAPSLLGAAAALGSLGLLRQRRRA